MRRLPLLFTLLASLIVPGLTRAQTQATPAAAQAQSPSPRDPAAIAVLQNAINALGGSAANASVTDATVTATVTPSPGSTMKAGTLLLKDAPPEFRSDLQTDAGTSSFVSGHGHPANQKPTAVNSLMPHMAQAVRPWHLPGVVLNAELTEPNYTITLVGPALASGKAAVQVHISLDNDPILALVTPQEWYFDSTTGLPLRVEYRLPDNMRPDSFDPAAAEFSNFQQSVTVMVPYQIVTYQNGAQTAVIIVTSVAFNTGLSPTEFDVPSGGN